MDVACGLPHPNETANQAFRAAKAFSWYALIGAKQSDLLGDREILVDGTDFRLLRDDASEIWRKEGQLYPYGTLTRVPFSFEEMCPSPNFNKKEWEILIPKLPSLPKNK